MGGGVLCDPFWLDGGARRARGPISQVRLQGRAARAGGDESTGLGGILPPAPAAPEDGPGMRERPRVRLAQAPRPCRLWINAAAPCICAD